MKKEMGKRVEQCNKENIFAELVVTIGTPAEEIMKIIKEKSVDFVIMAKRRKLKGVMKLLSLGSTSRKIVENVKCPVLLIDIERL